MTTESTPRPNAVRLERAYDAPAELILEMFTTRGVVGLRGP
jgi:hypothetical protein